jgi:SPP1 gp7 family putative phage head morphogenesis protein
MKKRNRKRKTFYQLALEFNEVLEAFEDSFIIKLSAYFTKLTNSVIKQVDSLPVFNTVLSQIGQKEIVDFKNFLNQYYKKVGKESVNRLNKEIKELNGIQSKIKIPAINAGIRYRSEQLAIEKVNDFKKVLREKVNESAGTLKEKADLKRTIRKASKVYINRHIKTVARMESITAANQARIQAAKESKIVKAFRFWAVIDIRTTDFCRSRHNHIIPLDSPYLDEYTPPCHFGCRSLLSTMTVFDEFKYTEVDTLESVPVKYFGDKADKDVKISKKRTTDQEVFYEKRKEKEKAAELRLKKISDLNYEELTFLSEREVNNADKIIKRKSEFKEYFTTGSQLTKKMKEISSLNSKLQGTIKTLDIETLREDYCNLRGKIRDIQIAAKLLQNEFYKIKFINKDYFFNENEEQEIDISFRDFLSKKNVFCEVKTGLLSKDNNEQLLNYIKAAKRNEINEIIIFHESDENTLTRFKNNFEDYKKENNLKNHIDIKFINTLIFLEDDLFF